MLNKILLLEEMSAIGLTYSFIKILGSATVGGGTVLLGIYLTSFLGKTKQEAEIVLNWEEIHAKRDKKLLDEIKRLEEKLDDYMREMDVVKAEYRVNLLKWENDSEKKNIIIREKDILISLREEDIDALNSVIKHKDERIMELEEDVVILKSKK